MKKIISNILLLAGVAFAPANNVSAQDSFKLRTLKTDADTLAYSLGMSQADALKEHIRQNGVETADMEEFLKGVNDGLKSSSDKKKNAYLVGTQIGMQISNQMMPGLSKDVYGDNTDKTISAETFIKGIKDGLDNEKLIMRKEESLEIFNKTYEAMKVKRYLPNIEAGKNFMENYSMQHGVKRLPCGVLYKVLKKGQGAIPSEKSKVKVNYEGKTIEGKVFDSSYNRGEPTSFGVTQVIKGWTEALKTMPVGSKWEVVIPYDLAYGERGAGQDIPPYSTLVFTIELISIEK